MNKLTLALIVSALIVPATLTTANADSCSSQTVIFSRNSNAPASVNSNALVCLAKNTLGLTDPDTAIINPGSDRVQIRYTVDIGEDSLLAHVEGLGLDTTVTLNRATTATGSIVYDSASLAIDPSARGTITATVTTSDGSEVLDEVTFHTAA